MYAESRKGNPIMPLFILVALVAIVLIMANMAMSSSNSLDKYPGSASEAIQWRALDFSPEQAVEAARRGLTPLQAAEEKAAREEGEKK